MSHDAPEVPPGTRWFGAGCSTAGDATHAGKEAAAQAMVGDDAKLLVVSASMAHDAGALLQGIRSVAPQTPLVGMRSGVGLDAAAAEPPSVAVAALGGSGFSALPVISRNVGGRLREAGAEVARSMAALPAGAAHRALLLLSDGNAGDQQDVVRGAYRVVGGAVPLAGGSSGDAHMRPAQQICGDEVHSDALVAVALASDAPIGVGVGHGWQPVGEPLLVTRSAGNHVLELDGRPALDVYLAHVGASDDVFTDPETVTDFLLAHPLGLATRYGSEVRVVGGADHAARALITMAAIPEGGMAWFMRGDRASALQGTHDALGAALDMLDGRPPVGVLAFDCVGRRRTLADQVDDSDQALRRLTGAPVATVPTFGEIARVQGMTGFHNHTLVVLALS